MGKKVLILSSSPRRGGNFDLLCDQFMLGAKEVGVIYGTGACDIGDTNGSITMKQAFEIGKAI